MGPFPFSAIVGQEDMKQAMIMTAIDSLSSAAFLCRSCCTAGTGKSTARCGRPSPPCMPADPRRSRACPAQFGPARLEDPGLGQRFTDRAHRRISSTPGDDLAAGWWRTEDRVVRRARHRKGPDIWRKAFRAGAAGAWPPRLPLYRRGQLLEDHLVDLLLDVAQSGQNVVEREGLSIRHPAALRAGRPWANPERANLRPQLLGPVRPVGRGHQPARHRPRIELIPPP